MQPRAKAGVIRTDGQRLQYEEDPDLWKGLVGLALIGVAAIFFLGTLIDFWILWFVQKNALPTYEFVALTSMAEGLSRPVLAWGLLFAGAHIGGWHHVMLRWALSAMAIVMGIGAFGGAALIGLDYLALAPMTEGQALATMRSVAIKGVMLSALAGTVLLPLGFYGLLVIKRKASDDTNL